MKPSTTFISGRIETDVDRKPDVASSKVRLDILLNAGRKGFGQSGFERNGMVRTFASPQLAANTSGVDRTVDLASHGASVVEATEADDADFFHRLD